MSCCPTFELNAIENTGNLASGQTDLVNHAALTSFIVRQTASVKPLQPLCCDTAPFISPSAGGNTSAGLAAGLLRQQQLCDASQNLAIAKLQQTNSTTQRLTTPGLVLPQSYRFQKYARRPNPVPCPNITTNAGVGVSPIGPCVNLVNFLQTWPPH